MHEYLRRSRTGVTSLPEVPPDDIGIGIQDPLSEFVLHYVGWATSEVDDGKHVMPMPQDTDFFVVQGKTMLGNTPGQTTKLLQWMEENPQKVVDYLDAVWGVRHSVGYTVPFRQKLEKGTLPKLPFLSGK